MVQAILVHLYLVHKKVNFTIISFIELNRNGFSCVLIFVNQFRKYKLHIFFIFQIIQNQVNKLLLLLGFTTVCVCFGFTIFDISIQLSNKPFLSLIQF